MPLSDGQSTTGGTCGEDRGRSFALVSDLRRLSGPLDTEGLAALRAHGRTPSEVLGDTLPEASPRPPPQVSGRSDGAAAPRLASIGAVSPLSRPSAPRSTVAASRRRVPRALAVTSAVAVSATLLGGCSLWARDLTLEVYAPSDGLQSDDLGDVLVRNVLVVSEGSGEPGVVSGALVSRADQDTDVLVEVGGASEVVAVGAGETVFLGGPDGEQVVVDAVEEAAGGAVEVRFTSAEAGAVTMVVPVQLPEGPYEDITP
jgi:hypothetical protein